MPWKLSSDRPIFIQILEHIRNEIIAGNFQPGEKLPSVRELAALASVNPNTMQRALSELERSGLVFSQRTSGRFITNDTALIQQLRSELAREKTKSFIQEMETIGFHKQQIIEILEGFDE